MAEKKIKMSAKGFEDLQNQLEYLKNVRRKEVAEKLKEARAQGDLSSFNFSAISFLLVSFK